MKPKSVLFGLCVLVSALLDVVVASKQQKPENKSTGKGPNTSETILSSGNCCRYKFTRPQRDMTAIYKPRTEPGLHKFRTQDAKQPRKESKGDSK